MKHSAGSEHLSVLNNFDLKQMELNAASIRAFDSEALQSDPPTILAYKMCFTTDFDAVSSAEKLCLYVQEKGKVPPGLEYIAHQMTKVPVKTGLSPLQAQRIYAMFADVRRCTQGSEEALRPIRSNSSLLVHSLEVATSDHKEVFTADSQQRSRVSKTTKQCLLSAFRLLCRRIALTRNRAQTEDSSAGTCSCM